MKIKAIVKLSLVSNNYVDKLSYKIKYKIDNQKYYNKINRDVTTSYRKTWDNYVDGLYHHIKKENIVNLAKKFIEHDITTKNKKTKTNDEYKQILQNVKNINKEKIRFEFDIDL